LSKCFGIQLNTHEDIWGPPLEGDDVAGGGGPPASEALLLLEAEKEVVLEAVCTDAIGLYVEFFVL
jgi:hypothetical protein